MEKFTEEKYTDEYEQCWYEGKFVDQYCPCCPFRNECSGYDEEE